MKNKGISLISIIIIVFIMVVLVLLGIILIKRIIVHEDSKEIYNQSNLNIKKSNDFDDKKELIDELNKKFYKENNSNNYYILDDCGSYKVETFVLDDKAKTYTTWYKTDENGNVNKDEISMIVERILIDNLEYYYRDNRDNTDIIKKINKMDEKIDTEEAWVNYISPSKSIREFTNKEKIESEDEKFINSVKIEKDNDKIIFTLNNKLDFYNCSTDCEKKVLVIDYKTGYPLSMTDYDDTINIRSTTTYTYKINCCTNRDFDLSKFKGIKISE